MKTFVLLLALASGSAWAAAPFTGTDYSGTYECKADDNAEGNYESIVTLKLDKVQSNGKYGAYHFKMEIPGYGDYPGHAAAYGTNMAIHFASTDAASKDYGTGIAAFTKKAGKWSFKKYYFEPEFKGGNFGFENCRQK
ncbi:hypothetical protein ACHMW6_29430 [Pseudoduganella sp. UC29_106]|uniref:hypothetical protein n=1 Tax=Pseudoduganella sp. UC29_106 TaxID=3374553 RepID=UPI003756A162